MKYIIIFLALTGLTFAQYATPSDYTDVLGLRLYDQGDNPGSDSLNQNWTDIDNWAASVAEEDSANTFTQRQTFTGAAFSAASYGTVTFNDSVSVPTAIYSKKYNPYDATSTMGSSTSPMAQIYTRQLFFPNTEGNDSVTISYDDSTLSFDKALRFSGLTITENVSIDSGATLKAIIYDNQVHTISDVADSIITLTSYSPSVELSLPGDVTSPGISRIHLNEATKGQVLVFWNPSGSYSITFTQSVADDDNLLMAGDITLAYADNITFQYIGLSGGKQLWMEVSRSNNVQ